MNSLQPVGTYVFVVLVHSTRSSQRQSIRTIVFNFHIFLVPIVMFKTWLDLTLSGGFDPSSVEQEKSTLGTKVRTAQVLALRTRTREIAFTVASVASPIGG